MRKKLRLLGLLQVCLFSIANLTNGQAPANFTSWKFSTGGYYNRPFISNDTLFSGSMDGNFYALNAKTGALLWKYDTKQPISTSAAKQDTVICFAANNKLIGLNIKNGKLLWSYISNDKIPTEGYPTNYQHSSPLIYNNTAYFGDEWGNMNGVNIYSGKLVFQYSITQPNVRDESDKNIRSKPAIKNDIIYFGDYGKRVYAISLKDSSEKWIHTMYSPKHNGSIVSEMVINDTVLYFGCWNDVFSPLSLKIGNPIWQFRDEGTFLPSTPIFYQENVIIGATMGSSKIHCLKAKDGSKVWTFQAKGVFFVKPIIIQDSILIINSSDPWNSTDKTGVLYFINCKNGQLINEVHLQQPTEASPVILDDLLFLGYSDGMYAIQYKPYLTKNETSKLQFDSSEEQLNIKQNESISKRYAIKNINDFCDEITVSATREGDESSHNILIYNLNNKHIKPSEELKFGFDIPENKLAAGNYTITFKINSSLKPQTILFTKTINIKVTAITTALYDNELQNNIVAYPNPFSTDINFVVPNQSDITLTICNLDGKILFTKQYKNQNNETIKWDGCDNYGTPIKNGMYVYSIRSKTKNQTGILTKK